MTGSSTTTENPGKPVSETIRGKHRKALIILGLVVALFGARPALVSYHLWQAAGKLRQHHTVLAEWHLARVLELDPQNAKGHFLFARLRRRQGSFDGMDEHLEAALKAGFSVERLDRERQFLLAQTGRFRDLKGLPGELLINAGEDGPDACEAVVNGMMLTYQLSSARGVIDAWAADYPEDPQPLYCRGVLYAEQENWPKAISSFRQALDRASDRTDIRVHLADAMMTIRQHNEAISEYRQALRESPSHVNAHVGLAECLRIMKQEDEARTVLGQALQVDPDSYEANLALGQLELNAGNSAVAVEQLRKAIEAKGHSVQARYILARALRAAGRNDESKEHFDRVEEQNNGLANLRVLLDRLNEEPGRVKLRYEIGVALLKFGDPAEGTMLLESVLEFDPHHKLTHTALGDYYSGIGEDGQAALHRHEAGP